MNPIKKTLSQIDQHEAREFSVRVGDMFQSGRSYFTVQRIAGSRVYFRSVSDTGQVLRVRKNVVVTDAEWNQLISDRKD